MMRIDYDEKFDTLYVVLTDNSNSYGEATENVILMRDIETDNVTGITVLSYKKKCTRGIFPVLPAETGLDFETDIQPKLRQMLDASVQVG